MVCKGGYYSCQGSLKKKKACDSPSKKQEREREHKEFDYGLVVQSIDFLLSSTLLAAWDESNPFVSLT